MESYTRKQEIVNGLTHATGVLFGLTGLPLLPGIATAHGNTAGVIGSCVYGICFLLLFASSTVYHLTNSPRKKRVFKIFDHIGIYFFIAGTYTPFLLVYMHNSFGMTLLIILWSLTVAGTLFKAWFTGKFEIISTLIYLAMGWIMVVGGRKFFDVLPHEVLVFIFAGAALYTIGVFFYLWDKYQYTHAVWHGFVLTAAICHYVAVLMAM
ncbi:PAQR family membrane homeostasis protein TrhA [Puia dinghuensis]|uniref:Hemolysin D n=1 Tax=Puia dinghuensis TaxID=1792502 RepID=A0A8J2UEM7_9BACT|nr:hemolysin III family protein [Puia dinghuensis]GGB06154.1 hemolysin D [Puia dinghuensis]